MAKETKDLETTEKKAKKKTVSTSKKVTKKSTSSSKKTVAKKATPSTKKEVMKKKTSPTKKTAVAKNTETKKKTTVVKKSSSEKKVTAKNSASPDKKNTTEETKKVAKVKSTAKKTTTKKAAIKKSAPKKSTEKKATAKKPAAEKKSVKKTDLSVGKKTSSKKVVSTKSKKSVSKFQAEYYDLPYMYNRTIVKVLAQTPKMLFIYWEISEDDRDLFKRLYGENFFNHTKPILIVYNDTMNYSFEVEVDDFANSWYLHINDANCEYHVELGRKPIPNINQYNQPVYIPYYVYVTSSNEMTSPNNTILFDPNLKTVRFRNVKTGEVKEKDVMQFTFITNIGTFNIKELYKFLFPNESFEFENIVLGNTSSGALSSSGMFSSQFK